MANFKGDSPGKKVARARLWLNMIKVMASIGVPYKGSLVLAGHGGDVGTLSALGIDRSTIVAVDRNGELAEYCAELYPGCVGYRGEMNHACQSFHYNAAHLDFCNGLTLDNIRTLAFVALYSDTKPAVVGVTMMKGREASEKMNEFTYVDAPRKKRREWISDARRSGNTCGLQLLKRGTFSPELAINRAKFRMNKMWGSRSKDPSIGHSMKVYGRTGKLTPLGMGMARVDALRACAEWLVYPLGLRIVIGSTYSYHSKCKTSGGSPFVSATMIVVHEKQYHEFMSHMRENVQSLYTYENMPGGESKEMLRDYVLDFSEGMPVKQVSELFDVPEDTIKAWKAHQTRGTYKGRKKRARVVKTSAKIEESPGFVSGDRIGWGVVGGLPRQKIRQEKEEEDESRNTG